MIIKLHFKTPDVLFYALQDLTEEEQEEAKEFIGKYVKYDENVTITFDTENKTAKVDKI